MMKASGEQLTVHDVAVSEADVDEYWRRGYWVSPRLLDEQGVDQLRGELGRIFHGERDSDNYTWFEFPEPRPGTQDINQVTNAWWVNRTVRSLVTHPNLGRTAVRLMRTDEARLWHDQVLCKPGTTDEATDDGNVGWRQDYAHWQCSNSTNMCSIWIALPDTDLHNGGMRTIVGSHRWGLREEASTFYEKDLDQLKQRFEKDEQWVDEPCVMKAGQASFHHSLTFHGSGPNHSAEARLCVIAHVMSAQTGLRTDGKWHLCATLLGPEAKTNDRFEGPFFPVLHREPG